MTVTCPCGATFERGQLRGRPRTYCERCRPSRATPTRSQTARVAAAQDTAAKAAPQPRQRRVPKHRIGVPLGCPLTISQFRALRAIADGLTYEQAALRLGCGASTIRTHLHRVFEQLDTPTSAQAAIYAYRAGWFDDGIVVIRPEHRARRADDVTAEQKLYTEALVRSIRSDATDEDQQEARVLLRIVRRKAAERKAAA